jgi:hypothetical protein
MRSKAEEMRRRAEEMAKLERQFKAGKKRAALAHAVGDKVEAAYRRGDMFEKRRRLMDAWAEYCAKPSAAGEVVTIGQRRAP